MFDKKIIGLQNYSGKFDVFPNVKKIQKMIDCYTSQPISYTLDVAISDNNTVVIEVHDFFSCGLYGFSNHKILPQMFAKWFYSFIYQ